MEKITPTDLKTEAQKLVATGKMPELPVLLEAVAKMRKKYAPELEKAKSEPSSES